MSFSAEIMDRILPSVSDFETSYRRPSSFALLTEQATLNAKRLSFALSFLFTSTTLLSLNCLFLLQIIKLQMTRFVPGSGMRSRVCSSFISRKTYLNWKITDCPELFYVLQECCVGICFFQNLSLGSAKDISIVRQRHAVLLSNHAAVPVHNWVRNKTPKSNIGPWNRSLGRTSHQGFVVKDKKLPIPLLYKSESHAVKMAGSVIFWAYIFRWQRHLYRTNKNSKTCSHSKIRMWIGIYRVYSNIR